jgi:hypothetical protein
LRLDATTALQYDSLIENDTWELITPPPGHPIIESRWTFKVKPATRTREKIFKARFVAKGFSQVPGVDYNPDEVYAPVIKHDSLRMLLSLTARLDLFLHTLDVKTAFLYGDLKEYLLVKQPEGFVQPGTDDLVCHLLKPLYGLVQSPRNWNDKFNFFLEKFGLTRSTADLCLYYNRGENSDDYTILGIWVDDGILATKTKEKAAQIIKYLESHFKMTSGDADIFVGLEIERDQEKRELYVHQNSYIQTVLKRFRMTGCNSSTIPADPNSRLTRADCPKNTGRPPMDSTYYRCAVGALLYIGRMTRPDILFSVNAASRFCEDPGKPAWSAVKRILSYLSGTSDYGIRYDGTQDNTLTAYSDSDYAGCPDTSRSTSGMLFMLNNGPISWTSHLQKSVAQSTCEAEYYAAGHASRTIVWLRELLDQLGFRQPEPTPLLCDNNSAISMVLNPVFHEKAKHIRTKHHYIRTQQENGIVKMIKVPSEDQLADGLTKPQPTAYFQLNRTRISVRPAPQQVSNNLN